MVMKHDIAYRRAIILLSIGADAMSGDNKKPRDRDGFVQSLSFLSQIGVTIIACIAVGILLGRFLDLLLGTTPWLLLVFTLLGIASAFKSIFDMAKKH